MASFLQIGSKVEYATVEENESQSRRSSKVLHFRNLSVICSGDNLCRFFGEVVNSLCGIGPNKNQALVEFADINEAISMVSYYASSSNQVQIQGRAVYIQYSKRPEIVAKPKNFTSGNVLLVTFEGVEIEDVSIDVVRSVFSAFGFVHKISMFNKIAGFQVLIQYNDNETATSAMDGLDGTSISKDLLPRYVDSCVMRISYSGHQDLDIKYQCRRARDYTNPMLPSYHQHSIDKHGIPRPNHVLWALFEDIQCEVTVDDVYEVFSQHGTVKKISIFKKNGRTHALIQYPDIATATDAKNALHGYMYDGGCKLQLSYSYHTNIFAQGSNDKVRDYTKDHEVSVAQVSNTTWQDPQVAYMNPNNSHALHAQIHGGQIPTLTPFYAYMPTPAGTFPNQAYAIPPYPGYALDPRNPMVQNEYYMETITPMVPGFSPHMQVGYMGYYYPHYYGYYY